MNYSYPLREVKQRASCKGLPPPYLRLCRLTATKKHQIKHRIQPSITKIEKRTDMYISTLRSHVEAMGGQLEVIAKFPDGNVKISNFSDLGKAALV